MCGRYGFSVKDAREVYNRFDIENTLEDYKPRYNVAPGQMNPVITKHSPNHISLMFWGLIPHWAKDDRFKFKTFNARAEGIDGSYWHKGRTFDDEMFTTDELFKKVMLVFNMQPRLKVVTKLDVCCFDLKEAKAVQETLFDTEHERRRDVSKALDGINNKWGEWTIYPALMHGREKEVVDRIAFGGVKELEEVYAI
jgi:hypothetical protein